MKLIKGRYIVWLLVAALSFFAFLPPGEGAALAAIKKESEQTLPCFGEADSNDIKISSRLYELLFEKKEDEKKVLLIPGGGIFGARIKQSYVSVQNPGDVKELKTGDKIKSVNGSEVHSVKEIKNKISELSGSSISLVCDRGGKQISVKITPKEVDGEYRLGMVLKDGAAGIGTITYIDPETGEFGGLGHGICDTDTREVIEFTEGSVTGVMLSGVKKGEGGKPGELSGLLTDKMKGELYANTECGVFGRLESIPEQLKTEAVEIAKRGEVHTGEATILSTVKAGAVREFKIEISEVNASSTGTKSFKIKVTDPTLIAITGGVVRGMSGSPIIQDGKLVGAVTHVLVNEPTEGYGIFIENMLNASRTTRDEVGKAA